MHARDPKLITLLFNECITNQDLDGLAALMSADHRFIDRNGAVSSPKEFMVKAWQKFFAAVPNYKNTFLRVESSDNIVAIAGFAYWSEKQPYDPVLWRATIMDDRVDEWRIFEDTAEHRKLLHLG